MNKFALFPKLFEFFIDFDESDLIFDNFCCCFTISSKNKGNGPSLNEQFKITKYVINSFLIIFLLVLILYLL